MSKLPVQWQWTHPADSGKSCEELLYDRLLNDASLPSVGPVLQPLPHFVSELPSVGEIPHLSFPEMPAIVLHREALAVHYHLADICEAVPCCCRQAESRFLGFV